MEGEGCSLCVLESKEVNRYLGGLLYEHVNERGIRKNLVESRGFCPRHGHLLAAMSDGTGVAILYKDQLQLFSSFLESLKSESPRKSLPLEWTVPGKCPACVYQDNTRNRFMKNFLEVISLPEGMDAFSGSKGLCVPHFLLVLSNPGKEEALRELIPAVREKFSHLIDEVKEFIRRQDFRYGNDDFGKERDAWRRALEMMVGGEDLF